MNLRFPADAAVNPNVFSRLYANDVRTFFVVVFKTVFINGPRTLMKNAPNWMIFTLTYD